MPKLLILLASIPLLLGAQETANLWINTTGGSCTRSATPAVYSQSTSCGTVAAAWTAAAAGDTVIAKGGTYSSAFSASGAKSSTVTIKAAAGENPWFAGSGTLSSVTNMTVQDDRPVTITYPSNVLTPVGISNGLTMGYTIISGSSANINFTNIDLWCQNQSPWSVVTGLEGTSCSAPIQIRGLVGFTMTGGSIGPTAECLGTGCSGSTNDNQITACASNAACSNITFNGVYMHDELGLDQTTHSEMWKIDQGQNITFKNSYFIHCKCNTAMIFFGQQTYPSNFPTADLITFENNVIEGPVTDGGYNAVQKAYQSGPNPTFTFRYNTIYGPFNDSGSGVTTANYNFTGNVGYMAGYFPCHGTYSKNQWYSDSSTSVQTCTGDNAGVQVNTGWWNNPTGHDYRIPTTSRLKDLGGASCSGLTDLAGVSRPQGAACDVGAFEFTAGATGTAPTITIASLAAGTVGVAYSQTLTATGDTPITWSVVVGSLPAWASLNTSTGAITGTPNAAATTSFTVRATNAAGQNDKALSITIAAAPVAPTITNLSPINTGTVGSAYGYQFNASGTTPITFTATNVPGGLTLLNGGWLSGTPTTAGTTTISVTATNSVGSNNKNFQITIAAAAIPPTITTTSPLPGGTVGIAYSATVAATGDAPITWSVLSGSLPAWASLNAASGAITGTPNAIATSNFTLQASNAAGTSNRAFALTIAAAIIPPAFITTSPLTAGMVGAGYSVQFTATGSTPITWSASGVPAGLTLSASGLLSGTPTTPGTSIIAVTATNAAGSAGPTGFSITISPAPTGAVLRGTFTGSWNIASVVPAVLAYTSPSCAPNVTYAAGTASNGWNGSGSAWACGPYPTTALPTPPQAACPVSATATNACTPGATPTYADADTGNRILRITTTGSLNSTANGTQFYTPASGWNKNWAPDSSGFIFAADNNREYYVGFNPSNMSTTGSSLLLPSGYQNWQFSGTSSNILYALANPNLVQYNLSTPGTAPTVLKNLNTIPGYISGQIWLAIYRGGDEICAYSGTSSGQGTGRLVACYNLTSGVSHMIDLGQAAATFDGTVISGINVGGMGTGNTNGGGTHSIVVGQDGRYIFVDTGFSFGSYSSTPPLNAQFELDLQTGTGSQWSWYSDQTHIAMGYGSIARQSAGNMLAVTGALCPYSTSGMDYRTFATPNPPVLTSGCFQASTTNSTHLSWANNANDANANQYPVILDTLNNVSGGNKQCLGCGEILALSATTTQNSATAYRFGQKWQTPAQGDYVYSSSQVSNDGRWVMFKSDWMNTAGAAGHRDIFIMELK